MLSTGAASTRPYRSSLRKDRARRTRLRVLQAASAMFVDRGYGGTRMRAVAEAAGVSVPTIEALFGTKAHLLKAAIDVAIAGDDEPVAVLDRPWAKAAQQVQSLEGLLSIIAGAIAAAQSRSAGLVLAVFEGSARDVELDELAAQMVTQREATATWIVESVARLAPLREDRSFKEAVETVWLLMDPAIFARLTSQRRWSLDRYRRWVADGIGRLLVTGARPERSGAQAGRAMAKAAISRPAVQVQLSVRRGREAVEFYRAAFGAREVFRFGGDATNQEVVAQLAIGDAQFWVEDESPDHHNFSPESLAGSTERMLLVVDEPGAVVDRALAAGAAEVYPVGKAHGWLLGRVVDPFGHHWEIGKPVSAWPPSSAARDGRER